MNKAMVLNTIISATAGGILGGVITYLTVKKTFEERTNSEIAEVKRHYALLRKEDGGLTTLNQHLNVNEEAEAMARRLVEELGYKSPGDAHPGTAVTVQAETLNIFDQHTELNEEGQPIEVVEEQDLYEKIEGEPYLISVAEFHQEKDEYDKITLTYYEADDVLSDERDQPIDNVDYLIGERHLELFGHQSEDKNVVYVRNENISSDFEVIRNVGSYEETILGVKPEKKSPSRMRDDD